MLYFSMNCFSNGEAITRIIKEGVPPHTTYLKIKKYKEFTKRL